MYWVVAVAYAVALMAALLAHELAHSLVAHRFSVPVTSITLWALGGVSALGDRHHAGPGHDPGPACLPGLPPDDPVTPLRRRPLADDLAAIVG